MFTPSITAAPHRHYVSKVRYSCCGGFKGILNKKIESIRTYSTGRGISKNELLLKDTNLKDGESTNQRNCTNNHLSLTI